MAVTASRKLLNQITVKSGKTFIPPRVLLYGTVGQTFGRKVGNFNGRVPLIH